MKSNLFVEFLGRQRRVLPGEYPVEFDCIAYGGFGYMRKWLRNTGDFAIFYGGLDDRSISEYDNIFVSVPFTWWIPRVVDTARKFPTKKFVLGGVGVSRMRDGIKIPSNVQIVKGFAEDYFGTNFELDSIEVSFPQNIPPDKVYVTVPVDYDCYWNKCAFCHQPDFLGKNQGGSHSSRGSVKSLLDCVPEGVYVELAAPALSVKRVRELCDYNQTHRHKYLSLVRADPGIISTLRGYRDLTGMTVNFGVESFCQRLVDSVGKGIKISNVVELFNLLLDKGANVGIFLLEEIPGTTKADIDEEFSTLSQLNLKSGRHEWVPAQLNWRKSKPCYEGSKFDFVTGSSYGPGYWILHQTQRVTEVNSIRNKMLESMLGPIRSEKVIEEFP